MHDRLIHLLIRTLAKLFVRAARTAEANKPTALPMNDIARVSPTVPKPPTSFSNLPPAPARTVQAGQVSAGHRIPREAFIDRTDLTEFTVPDGVRVIGYQAFCNCSALQRITLPDTLEEIESRAFRGCASLREIVIPDSVKKIGDQAFCDCSALQRITLPDTLEEIESRAFHGCKNLRQIILSEGLDGISDELFGSCHSLEEIYLPPTVTRIGRLAFVFCTQLREVILPDSVTEIGDDAFSMCSSLEQVRLPVGVTFGHTQSYFQTKDSGCVSRCFSGADALHTVILGTKLFPTEGMLTDDALMLMYAALAADGDRKALDIVQQSDLDRLITQLTVRNDTAVLEALLGKLDADLLTADLLQSAYDYASMIGQTEVFRIIGACLRARHKEP